MMLRMMAVMGLVLAMVGGGGRVLAEKAHVLESLSDAVDKVLTVENLRTLAAKTTDAEVLLGLGYVAPTGSAARPELLAKAVKLRPEYGPAAIILEMAMEGVDEKNVATLIKADPNNALGYYLQAYLFHQAGKEKEELDVHRKGAKCAEIRLYGTMTAEALFKGLDTLGLKGRDRLAALGWTSARMHNFYLGHLQRAMSMSRFAYNNAEMAVRKDVSEMLLVLSGQFYQVNFQVRAFSPKAVTRAFRIKAEVAAAEKSPTMNGYMTAVQALTSMDLSWPGFAVNRDVAWEAALFFDLRTTLAEAMGNAKIREAYGYNTDVPEQDKAAFEKAKTDLIKAAEAVVELCASDPDGIIGAYLKGLPPMREDAKGAEGVWVSRLSYVELLMLNRSEIFQAVAAYNEASLAMHAAKENALSNKNIRQLKELTVAIIRYAQDHQDTFPESLEVLYKDGKYLKDAVKTRSLLTDKPYVYVAKGEKWPEKDEDYMVFIVAYDEHEEKEGMHVCAFGDGHVEAIPMTYMKELLKKRGK